METRAKAGGQHGINGEFYKGGQFLPGSEDTVPGQRRHAKRSQKPRKVEIAPYCWQYAPAGKVSIWTGIANLVRFVGETGYSKETGRTGTIEPVDFNWQGMGWTEAGYQSFLNDVAAWNAGERWTD